MFSISIPLAAVLRTIVFSQPGVHQHRHPSSLVNASAMPSTPNPFRRPLQKPSKYGATAYYSLVQRTERPRPSPQTP